MTLIPLISAIVAAPEAATAPVGLAAMPPRTGYDPGAGHRPVAALFAIGVPVALLVAAALSPMIVADPPQIESEPWDSIFLPKPKPPEPADAAPKEEAKPKTDAATDTVDTVFKLPTDSDTTVAKDPIAIDPLPLPPGPPIAIDPPPPKLVVAQIDGRFADAFQPDYPASEQRREVEGLVKVRVLIGTDGRVKAVELLSSDSPGFFAETKRRALAKWRFKPATRGGVPEESWKVMTVRFELRSA